jgi:hypothetical protein
MWCKRGVNISEQPFIIKLGTSSGPKHFVKWRWPIARLISESEIYGILKKSEQLMKELFRVTTEEECSE